MTELIEFRERLRKLYAENGRVIIYFAKFILLLLSLIIISIHLNYSGILSSVPVMLVIVMVVSFLPHSAILTTLLLIIGAELYSFGIEPVIAFLAMLLVFVTVFFIFKPEKSFIMTMGIVLGLLQFYGMVPMIIGLLFTPLACIYMCFGLCTSSLISYIADNQAMFSQDSSLSMPKKLMQIVLDVFTDEALWVNLFIVIIIALIIYFIRKMSVKHSWTIAVVVGCLCTLFLSIICSMMLDNMHYIVLIINFMLELITGLVINYLFHMVDYSREEVVQFEDDEYFYYVKAVPKLTVAIPETKVTRIRSHNIKNVTRTSEQIIFVKDEGEVSDGDEKWEQIPPPPAEEVPENTLTDFEEETVEEQKDV